jgi:hypothetical protein
MPIVGGLDIHRKQITFDYLDTVTGQVQRGAARARSGASASGWGSGLGSRSTQGLTCLPGHRGQMLTTES